MAKGTRNKGGGSANKEVNKENHKNIGDNRQQNHSTDHPGNVKGGKQHRNKQKIVVSIFSLWIFNFIFLTARLRLHVKV